MQSNKVWTVEIQQDEDDLILPLPQEMLKELDWTEGDVLNWIDNEDGSWSLIKG